MLGMMTVVPSICFARNRTADSLLVKRMWHFYEHDYSEHEGTEKNLYMKYHFSSKRRNVLLNLVPTMYSIARGKKDYVGESYSKLRYRENNNFEMQRQVICGTIPRHRSVMPSLYKMITPNLYGTQLFQDRILSPFHQTNRYFYKYRVTHKGNQATIHFRPRSSNTQLIAGTVEVDVATGRILALSCEGEFDMIDFKINATMDRRNPHSSMPDRCTTEATFKFLGNDISSHITCFYNCPTTLPDSINNYDSPEMMSKLRPVPLKREEEAIYSLRRQEEAEEEQNDSIQKGTSRLKEVAWDIIGDNLINSTSAHHENLSLHVSPLLNPLYMGYSPSSGISYKLDVGARYAWDAQHYLTLNPRFGYSFKREQFYYTIPLRMTYNARRNGYVEMTWGNGNRTSHATLYEAYQKAMGDNSEMPDFEDEYFRISNNNRVYKWLDVTAGLVWHRRSSSNPDKMSQAGLVTHYHSFAPTVSLHLRPWEKGPTLTVNYERGISHLFHSNLSYGRWEFDGAYKYQNKSIRILNMRAGAGFYTHRSTDFFVDFTNFRDNNLATGWEDDWTGQFQLVESRWYNESNYYVRGHISYDSPLLMLSWLPYVGRIVETERIYISALSIEHTRPYYELGYGFQNRYFSTAVFGSFLNHRFQKFGCKFTIELFRRW
jgi:hypothetical protein